MTEKLSTPKILTAQNRWRAIKIEDMTEAQLRIMIRFDGMALRATRQRLEDDITSPLFVEELVTQLELLKSRINTARRALKRI